MPISPGYKRDYKPIACVICSELFEKKRSTQKFCSSVCKGKYKYQSGNVTTETQYAYVSGNWLRYLNRLTFKNRRESGLSANVLMQQLVLQNYKCALTGKEMTCILEKGKKCSTNASIDRKIAGGPYTIDNIQLVCAAVNKFRVNMPIAEFVMWCTAVAKHHSQEAHHV